MALSSGTFIAFFFVGDLWQISAAIVLYGLGSASVYVMSSTMAADTIQEESRATHFGAFDALIDLGLVAGPVICYSVLSFFRWSISTSFLLMAAPSIVALALIPRFKETKA